MNLIVILRVSRHFFRNTMTCARDALIRVTSRHSVAGRENKIILTTIRPTMSSNAYRIEAASVECSRDAICGVSQLLRAIDTLISIRMHSRPLSTAAHLMFTESKYSKFRNAFQIVLSIKMHQNKPQVSSKHSFDVSIVQKSDKTTVQNQKCLIFALGFRYCKRMPPSPLFPKVLFGSPIELSLPVQQVSLHRRLPVPRAQTEAPETSRGLGHFQQRWS